MTTAFFVFLSIGAHAQGLSVSGSGTPSYTIPIGVPPGIGGMTPNIGLLYSASGVNGPVGHGWSVQGISLITRCAGNKRTDGVARSVEYSVNDKLCLDGQRLIQTDTAGTPLASQQGDSMGGSGMVREYRTDKDIYARIRAYGSSGDASNGPSYFKVWTKSGQIYEYGDMAGKAAINVTGKGLITAWAVNRISDTVGNYIDFRYAQRDVAWGSGPDAANPTLGHEWQLKEIMYTGTVSELPFNRVVFDYTERPNRTSGTQQDRSEAYHQGGKNVSVWLLDKVSTYINWPANAPTLPPSAAHVKTIKLDYDNGPVTARSRLVKVRECADANLSKCLPATSFEYAAGGGLSYEASPSFSSGELAATVLHSVQGNYGVLTGNFFGSGRTSILRWSDIPSENRLFRSDGDGQFTAIPNGTGAGQFNLLDQNLFKSDDCYTSVALDFNGDGLTDIFRARGGKNSGCGTVESILYLSNGDGSFRAMSVAVPNVEMWKIKTAPIDMYDCSHPHDPSLSCEEYGVYIGVSRPLGQSYYFVDVNNDGILDIITTISPSYTTTMTPLSDAQLCANRVCTKVYLGQVNGSFAELQATNLAHVSLYGEPLSDFYPNNSYIADVNGDGLADFVVDSGIWLSRGDGNFDFDPEHQATLGCEFTIDFNGDGRSDCINPSMPSIRALAVADGTYKQKYVGNYNLRADGVKLIESDIYGRYISGVQVGNFSGGSRTDILHWKDDPSQNKIYVSNGDGTFSAGNFNLNTSSHQLQKSDGTARFVLGDFSGRGSTEILRLKASPSTASEASRNQLYVKRDATPPDQLMSVKTGNGITTSLTWVPLTMPNTGSLGPRYISDRGTSNAAVYPMVDVLMPTYVVATMTSNAGFGGALQISEYAYTGMKMAYDGRGWLGFRANMSQSTAPNGKLLTVTTHNIQQGPNPGPASITETRLGALNEPAAQLLSRSSFIYCDKTAAAGAEASATSSTPCDTNAKVQRPYLYQSIEEGWDLDGTGLPKVTTTNSFNNSGDATEIYTLTVSTSGQTQSSSKRTTNEYLAANTDGDSWILGRLTKATVLNDVTHSSLDLPTSAGTAPLATAHTGTGSEPEVTPLIPSVNPASLMPIIMMLLGDD